MTSKQEGSYNTDKLYTGKTYDASVALYYYGARYYDPELGRFIQPDSIVPYPEDPQALNRYTYCRNNPIAYTDPTGNFWWAIIAAIIGAVVGAIAAHNAGGNVWLGAAVGAACGYFGAGLANMTVSAMGIGSTVGAGATAASSWGGAVITPMEGALITGTEFAIGGFAAGIATGYAGGKGNIGDIFSQAGIGAAIGFGTGFAVGYSYTAGWQSVVHGADTRATNAKNYEQKIKALRADCKTRPDRGDVTVGARNLSTKTNEPAKFSLGKHSFIEETNSWEMGPYKGKITTSNTVENLSEWGTHIATERAISSGAISKVTVSGVSASGLKEAQALYEEFWVGQTYIWNNHNSNYAVNTVIFGAGGDVPEGLGYTPGFPDKIK